jgi:hypothetical protein
LKSKSHAGSGWDGGLNALNKSLKSLQERGFFGGGGGLFVYSFVLGTVLLHISGKPQIRDPPVLPSLVLGL